MTILFAFLVVGLLGAALGVGLGFASQALAVRKDERLEELEGALPGVNCGACGYAGCASYAGAIATEDADLTLCSPGGPDVAAELGRIMGVDVSMTAAKKVTQVHCRGGQDVSEYGFQYHGLEDCNALHLLYGGDKVCKSSCLGLGTCIRVCPVDAIDYDAEGRVWVDKDVCISCGQCITVCPTGVMKWVPYDADYIVACNNTEPGKLVRKYCKVGCTGCKVCEKRSPDGGFVIDNNLSTINYEMTGDRSAGAEKCPAKCIIPAIPVEARPVSEPAPAKPAVAAETETKTAGEPAPAGTQPAGGKAQAAAVAVAEPEAPEATEAKPGADTTAPAEPPVDSRTPEQDGDAQG